LKNGSGGIILPRAEYTSLMVDVVLEEGKYLHSPRISLESHGILHTIQGLGVKSCREHSASQDRISARAFFLQSVVALHYAFLVCGYRVVEVRGA